MLRPSGNRRIREKFSAHKYFLNVSKRKVEGGTRKNSCPLKKGLPGIVKKELEIFEKEIICRKNSKS
jgi:hypothetical protein